MSNVTRPLVGCDWTDGSASRVSQPTPDQVASGYAVGQRPTAQVLNYQFWLLNQWISYLDGTVNANALTSAIEPLMRLIGGGTWAYSATTGLLSWSAPAYLAVPGLADSANTLAAGSVTLSAGQVAVFNGNIPFAATGSTTSGSSQVTGLNFVLGITAGQLVSGAGIPAGTTVASVSASASTLTLSQAATASASGVSLTFVGQSAPTVTAVAQASLTPAPNTVVLARSTGATCIVGVNSGQFVLRDNEARLLDEGGFATVVAGTAGQALAARTAVYVSAGTGDASTTTGTLTSGSTSVTVASTTSLSAGIAVAGAGVPANATVASVGTGTITLSAAATASGSGVTLTFTRTAGQVYPADASVAGGPTRAGVVGLVMSAAAAGAACNVVTGGLFAGFSGLSPGARYYLDPATPGALTTTRPSTTNQYITPVGTAATATLLALRPDSPTAVVSINPWPQYGAASQADLTTALTACAAGGGGVVVITGSFTLGSALSVPANTVVQGRRGAAVLTLGASGTLTLLNQSELRDVNLTAGTTGSGTLVTVSGTGCVVRGCTFTQPSGSSGTSLAYTGSGNRSYNNAFYGVSGSSTATGISYGASAVSNQDDSSVFFS